MKKLVIVLLTLLLAVSWVYAGGGGQQSGGASSASAASLTDDRSKTLDIIWWGFNNAGILPYEGSIVQREMEKRYNIKITNVMVDSYNGEQKNLLIATGIDFDVVCGWAGTGSLRQRVDSGLIRPVSEDIIRKFAPGIVKVLEASSPIWPGIASVDGVMYGFPHFSFGQGTPWSLTVRTDWLRNLGITTLPKTLDELETFLLKFRNDDPDRNGRKDTYALSLCDGNGSKMMNPYLFASYGVQLDQWGYDTDGSPKWYAIDDNYRQALAKMSEWWAKEIYDPSIVVNRTRLDNFNRVANGLIAGYFGQDWSIVSGANPSAISGWEMYINNHPGTNPENFTTYIPPVQGPKGSFTIQYGPTLMNSVTTFGRKTSDEKVVRILSMFNDIITNKDLYLMTWYGLENQHWVYDANKMPVMLPDWNTPEKMTEIGANRFYPHIFQHGEFIDISFNSARMKSRQVVANYPILPIHLSQLITTQQDIDYGSAAGDIALEYFWKTITGEWNVNNTWNDYVNRWKAAGGQQIIDAKKKVALEMNLNSK